MCAGAHACACVCVQLDAGMRRPAKSVARRLADGDLSTELHNGEALLAVMDKLFSYEVVCVRWAGGPCVCAIDCVCPCVAGIDWEWSCCLQEAVPGRSRVAK